MFVVRVAVVTPYCREPVTVLRRCHDSVSAQTHASTTHIMVADGYPRPELDGWKLIHIRLPHNNDFGDTPRLVGTSNASALGFDAITLLDADNWFEPDHVEALLDLHRRTGAPVITGTRMLRRQDESVLGICMESNGQGFNDTNCYLIMRPAFPVFQSWGFKDPALGIVGDRIFWAAVQRSGLSRAHCSKPTMNYVTTFAHHYQAYDEEPPPNAKMIVRSPGPLAPGVPAFRMVMFKDLKP